jgi:hypothetical protein
MGVRTAAMMYTSAIDSLLVEARSLRTFSIRRVPSAVNYGE